MSVEWVNPAALAGLAAVAAPVLVHLLRRQRATRVAFPSLRFLTPSTAAAVRMRSPADPWLLLIRMAVLAAAAMAWAQPVVITDATRQRRERDTARAMVVDARAGAPSTARQAREAASAERGGAVWVSEISTDDLRAGVRDAVRRLNDAPAARREIVVVSDFQHGVLDAADVASIPTDVGVRFVAVRGPAGSEERAQPFSGLSTFGTSDVAATTQTVELLAARTAVVVAPDDRAAAMPRVFAAPDAHADVERALRIVAKAGAPATSTSRALGILFSGGSLPSEVSSPRAEWMTRALIAMRRDAVLREAAERLPGDGDGDGSQPLPDAPWVPVAHDGSGRTVVAIAALGHELVARLMARPSDYLAVAAIHTLLVATSEPPAWIDRELQRIPEAQLQAWTRPPGPMPAGRWRTSGPGDARWCWAMVLVLLGLETIVRRTRPHRLSSEESARAA
jgi:Aerotolerance regulator N-terminal